jgi:hypothetical protein
MTRHRNADDAPYVEAGIAGNGASFPQAIR